MNKHCFPLFCQLFTGLAATGLTIFATQADESMLDHDALAHIETIVIQSQRDPMSIDVGGSLANTAQADLRDVLFQFPGMDINGNGPLSGILQYRGLFGDRIAVEQQGGPIVGSGPNGMDSPMSHFIARPGARINVQRGIAPVTMGPESLGGLIEFSTDANALFAEEQKFTAGVVTTYQSQGDATLLSGHLGYHSTDTFVQAFAQQQERSNIDSGAGTVIPNTFYERDAWGIDAGWQQGNHRLTGHYQNIDTGPTGTAALDMDIVFVASERYQLAYQWTTDRRQISLNAFGNNNQHDMNNFMARQIMAPAMARLNSVDSYAQGYEVQWAETFSSGVLTVGADQLSANHNSTIINPQAGTLQIHNFNGVERDVKGLYAQWQSQWEQIALTTGLRFNQVDASAGEVSHSMAMMNPAINTLVNAFNTNDRHLDVNYLDWMLRLDGELTDAIQWQASAAQKHRAPSYTELFVWFPLGISGGMADGRNYIGNLNLREEQANKLDIGITYKGEGIQISPRLFYDDIKDYIVGSPSQNMTANMVATMMSGQPPLQWQNTDVRLFGMDVLVGAKLSEEWQLSASGQYVRADRQDINQPLFRIAPASLLTQLQWQRNALSASIESLLVARQDEVSTLVGEAPSAGYGVVHLSGRYQLSPQLSLSLRLNNALDKFYQPHLNGVNRVASEALPRGEALPEPGRNWILSLAAQF